MKFMLPFSDKLVYKKNHRKFLPKTKYLSNNNVCFNECPLLPGHINNNKNQLRENVQFDKLSKKLITIQYLKVHDLFTIKNVLRKINYTIMYYVLKEIKKKN